MKGIGYPVSIALHVAVLVAAVVSLPATQPLAPAEESLPVEILTPEEFAAITKGEKTAKPKEKPEFKVDKIAQAEIEDDNPAETVKREAVSTPPPPRPKSLEPETPEPETPKPETPKPETPNPETPKPVAKAEPVPEPPKPEPKPREPVKPDPPKLEAKPEPAKPKPKPIAKAESDKLDELALKALQEDEPKPEKKPELKPEPPKAEAKPAKPAAKPVEKPAKVAESAAKKPSSRTEAAEPSRSFDPSKISALLSKEAPARKSRSDTQASTTASLGSSRGTAPKLSLSQRSAIVGAIMSHVSPCWSPPSFAQDASGLDVLIAVDLKQDGTLATDPQVIKYPANKSGSAAAGAAMRAIKRCVTAQTPLKLPPNLYASWREIEINFDPRQMAGG
jgi:colicin import membrane protein